MTSPIPLRGDRALSLLNIGPDGSCPTLGHCTQPSLFLLRPLAHTSTADTCEAVRGRSKIASPSPARASSHLSSSLRSTLITLSFILSPLVPISSSPSLLFSLVHQSIPYHLQVCHLAIINCCTHCSSWTCGELGSPCVLNSHSHSPTLVPLPPSLYSDSVSLARFCTHCLGSCHYAFRPPSYTFCVYLSRPIILPFSHYTFDSASEFIRHGSHVGKAAAFDFNDAFLFPPSKPASSLFFLPTSLLAA